MHAHHLIVSGLYNPNYCPHQECMRDVLNCSEVSHLLTSGHDRQDHMQDDCMHDLSHLAWDS